ncbi:sensor histidine kinase [Pseudonocardia phyllosphaerae]|uniref:sensor histidine kinase n=1 Tax=Pseudonocardia phyllosphaerae TaxID=3390502 RepID=UPI00397E333B
MTGAHRPSAIERCVAFTRRNPMIVDGVLALVLLAIGAYWIEIGKGVRADSHLPAYLAAVPATVPVAFRRVYPVPAAVVTAVVCLVTVFSYIGSGAILLPALVMAYSVVAYGPRWARWATAAVLVLGMVGPLVPMVVGYALRGSFELNPESVSGAILAGVLALLVVVCVLLFAAIRSANLRFHQEQAERLRLLEEGRRQEVRLELLAERSRISREVHDVVAHSLSVIIAQADGGMFAAQRDPQKAVDVLGGIADTGRDALGDVRGLLTMLRDQSPSGPDGTDADDPSRPQPGTADIPALVEQTRAGGLPVEPTVTGTPQDISSGAGLAAYRVVQEALTNVVKHAGPATPTHVTMAWTGDELTVDVRDDGTGTGRRPDLPRGGHGLVGMRERAALHGGSVETGPLPEGGYAVRLRLPTTPAPANRGER